MIACFAFTARDEAREGRRAQHKHTIPKTRHDASPSRALPSRHARNLVREDRDVQHKNTTSKQARHGHCLYGTRESWLRGPPSPLSCSLAPLALTPALRTHRCLHPCSSISTDSRAHSLARCPSPVISRHLSRPSRSLPKLFIFALSRDFSPCSVATSRVFQKMDLPL